MTNNYQQDFPKLNEFVIEGVPARPFCGAGIGNCEVEIKHMLPEGDVAAEKNLLGIKMFIELFFVCDNSQLCADYASSIPCAVARGSF